MMKEEAVPTKKRRRKYDRTFKAEAVALWQKSGKTADEIAAQLGTQEDHAAANVRSVEREQVFGVDKCR